MSKKIDYSELIKKANAIVKAGKHEKTPTRSENTANISPAEECMVSSLRNKDLGIINPLNYTDESNTTVSSASDPVVSIHKGDESWHPDLTENDEKFNGHFYDTPTPLAKSITFYPEFTTFRYSDGHEYSTKWGKHKPETILKNIAAAPVFTLSSKFEQISMEQNYMVTSLKESLGNSKFWEHAYEVVVEGSWHASTLKSFVETLPKHILSLSIINYTVHGYPGFDIEDIVRNQKLKGLRHLLFNCQATQYTDMYGNIKILKAAQLNAESIYLLANGMPSTEARLQSMIKHLGNMFDKENYGSATILTTEHIDDRIYGWLQRLDSEYAGKTKKMIYNTEPVQYQYYETFNVSSSGKRVTLGFLARN